MRVTTKIMFFVLTAVFVFGAAYAKFAKPEDAIKYRKAVMYLVAQHFKPMGAVVQGKSVYNKESFSKNSEVVAMLSTLPWEASMEPGSDKGDTTLSPAVFKDKAKFMQAAKSFESDSAKLADIAKGGDLGAIKAQFGVVAQNCKSCHQQFRSK